MPDIKFKHLLSCTSEDKVHKAENLLKPEMYRKWKCATPGEKKASVILQFDKASEIHSIDIGNESSAFVEVLVGKSSDTSSDYQVLLAASSFMSPLESRNDSKNNRVRMFGPEKLSQNLKNEKWDCVQIVCTQPFNKNIQYGLSFIKFHSPPDQSKQSSTDEAESKESLKLGAFQLKTEDDSNKLVVGSLFKKRNENSNSLPVTGPAAIRKASSFASAVLASAENSASKILLKASTQISPGVKRKHSLDPTGSSSSNNQKAFTTTRVDKDKIEFKKIRERTPERDKPSTSKASGSSKFVDKPPKVKPFNRVMEKVVFVLSGFQNPYRSELRDKALEMGAKYQGDWNDSCTHLVCAFLNTPKYAQVVKEKGRIVAREWILDCYKKKKHLPWRKYMLGKYSKDTTTEEEESETENGVPISAAKEVKSEKPVSDVKDAKQLKETANKNSPDSSKTNGTITRSPTDATIVADSEEEDYQADTEPDSSSGGDTEDEIRKVEEQQAKRAKLSGKKNKESETYKRSKVRKHLFDGNSSEETDDDQCDSSVKTDTKDLPLPDLPEFFKGKYFFLFGDFSTGEMHKLRRYIIGFNGSIEDYMGEKVKFVITNNKWDKNFDDALCENDNLIFVRPQWIFKCGQDCRFVPYQPYIVVPNA